MPKKTEPAHMVKAVFCDNSTAENRYDLTNYGQLRAKDDFYELCEKGQVNNTIYAHFPHVVQVTLILVDLPSQEPLQTDTQEFICEHVRKNGAASA